MKEKIKNNNIITFYDCPICSKLKNFIEINLGRTDEKLPEIFETFETIWRESKRTHYEYITYKIIKCKTCHTYYHYHYLFDNEDSPMTPITEIIKINRWGLLQAKIEMEKLIFDDEVEKILKQYSQILERYIRRVQKRVGKKTREQMKIPIQEIIDYSLYIDNGQTIENVLLNNNDSWIAAWTINSLITASKKKFAKIHNYDEKITKNLKRFVKQKIDLFLKTIKSWFDNDSTKKIKDGLELIKSFLSYKINSNLLQENVLKLVFFEEYDKEIFDIITIDFFNNNGEFVMPIIMHMILNGNERKSKLASNMLNREIEHNNKVKSVFFEELKKMKKEDQEKILKNDYIKNQNFKR